MPDDRLPTPRDPSSPERNPLGLGPSDAESSDTGSVADTIYNARSSDPYTTGEPHFKSREAWPDAPERTPADEDAPSSDEP